MSEEEEKKAVKIQIHLPEEMAAGRYSNGAVINFSPTEFVLDFLMLQPQQPRATVISRIVMHPGHVNRLKAALEEQIKRYEARFGKLPEPPTMGGPITLH